jgi:DNA polymerase III epsilon subunit-like protein
MSAARKILVIDTETGGLDATQQSILSLGAVIWSQGSIVDSIHILIHEAELHCDDSALKVNGFTREQIEVDGIGPAQAVQTLHNFLLKNDYRGKVVLAGHNVQFDIGFLRRLYRLAGQDFDKKFSYRPICTMTLALALELAERFSFRSTSLNSLCEHFGITIRAQGAAGAHNAKEDAMATARLLTVLLDFIRYPDKLLQTRVALDAAN